MTDAVYVLAGYVITVVALGGYSASLLLRARRARRLIDEEAYRR